MNELERKIDAVLDAGEPENRLAELRERLARLLKLSALDADRLEVYREKVERQLVERFTKRFTRTQAQDHTFSSA